MFFQTVKSDDIFDRLNSEAYAPEHLECAHKLKKSGLPIATLGELVSKKINNSIRGVTGELDLPGAIIPMFRPADISGGIADPFTAPKLTNEFEAEHEKSRVFPGDLVLGIAGTVGCIGRVPLGLSFGNINGSSARILSSDDHKSAYLLAYFQSRFGQSALLRYGVGSVQKHLNLEDLPIVSICNPHNLVQKYIGDKIRQAELLQARAKLCSSKIDKLVSNSDISSACKIADQRFNRPKIGDLTTRLDPKYYGNKSVAVFRLVKTLGKPLATLVIDISNGFEERTFFDTGLDYITVTEVSSGRLELSSAPKIAATTIVPAKAKIHERCVLVVRTGSIGNAVKVDARDSGLVISSHLIRLEFADEATAAAIAAFLSSPAGKILQHKISYGAVQPQIGQDELLALPIPQFVLDAKDIIFEEMLVQENSIRLSKSLTTAAKLLVEALIEGQIDKNQLITAQTQLQTGDNSLDRNILNRLKTDGLDGTGQALFPDLDHLYSLLEQAQQTCP